MKKHGTIYLEKRKLASEKQKFPITVHEAKHDRRGPEWGRQIWRIFNEHAVVERIELDQTVDFALRNNFMIKNIETVLNKSAVNVSF